MSVCLWFLNFVYARERERERQKDMTRDRQTDRQTDRQRERDRQTDRQTETHTQRQRQRHRERGKRVLKKSMFSFQLFLLSVFHLSGSVNIDRSLAQIAHFHQEI